MCVIEHEKTKESREVHSTDLPSVPPSTPEGWTGHHPVEADESTIEYEEV